MYMIEYLLDRGTAREEGIAVTYHQYQLAGLGLIPVRIRLTLGAVRVVHGLFGQWLVDSTFEFFEIEYFRGLGTEPNA